MIARVPELVMVVHTVVGRVKDEYEAIKGYDEFLFRL